MSDTTLWRLAHNAQDRLIAFLCRLIQARSFSGEEEQAARLVLNEMQALSYDDVQLDGAGNIIGRLAGKQGSATMLHAHLDIVDPGDVARWSRPPFGGEVADGYVWGRGTSDDKGCIAAQVYAAGLLKQAGLRPAGDVYVAAVGGEESGGLGTRYLARSLRPDLAIIGEPSGNLLRHGHRGRFEFIVTIRGRSAHASAPERGLNPHYSMARFLLALREAPMARNAVFHSNVTPTLAYVDQRSANVIPAELSVHLDWRNAPSETVDDARAIIERILAQTVEPGLSADIAVHERTMRSYTGVEEQVSHNIPSFYLEADDSRVIAARQALELAVGHSVAVGLWAFTTDGGHLASKGIPCLGYGPGEEAMAHVLNECIAIDQVVEATVGYMALALEMGIRL